GDGRAGRSRCGIVTRRCLDARRHALATLVRFRPRSLAQDSPVVVARARARKLVGSRRAADHGAVGRRRPQRHALVRGTRVCALTKAAAVANAALPPSASAMMSARFSIATAASPAGFPTYVVT